MGNDASLAGQDSILEESTTSEVIGQQEERQDLIIFTNSVNNKLIDVEEELDPITKAIRQEILLKQRNILKEYIAEKLDSTVDKHHDQEFTNYLKNINNRVIINQVFASNKVKAELEKVEIEGYKKVHYNFADRFQTINWQDGEGQENVRTQVVRNDIGDQLAMIKETTYKNKELVSLANGTTGQINSYRTIDLPTKLESNSGPLHLSLVVQDENGKSIAKDKAVYFTAHYDNQGKLIEISSPKPVKFNGQGDDTIGYIEHQGSIYTLPVTQGKYREMLLALEKNKGQEIDLSQITDVVQDRVITSDADLPRPEAKKQYYQDGGKSAEETLIKVVKHYQFAKQQAESILQGLQFIPKHDSTDNKRLFEQRAADCQLIHGLTPSQAISQYQTILEKLQPAISSRDQERESLQQLAQQNPTLAAKIVEEHLDTHAAEYKKASITNPISKVLQWFKQVVKVGSDDTKSPLSSVEQQLSELSRIKEKAALMSKEADQLIAKIAAADQSWHEALSKIQTLTDNLPDADPNKEKLTTFVKLQLEEEAALKRGKPLAKSKERDEALITRTDYEDNQDNPTIDNNPNTDTVTAKNINLEQTVENNSCKTRTEQMIARLMNKDYTLHEEKAVEKASKNCKVNSNIDIIPPPITISKVQLHKIQVNKR